MNFEQAEKYSLEHGIKKSHYRSPDAFVAAMEGMWDQEIKEKVAKDAEARKGRRKYLNRVKHGHDFNAATRDCRLCGMGEREYLSNREPGICRGNKDLLREYES
tara:strand:- start:3817 stop:4128 length:312 start_codon:yes stop_codon:yes gene_type:complete